MSSNGLILAYEMPYYPGYFTELQPYENPVVTMLATRGYRNEPNKEYTYTTHTNNEASSGDLKPDNASPTYGSTGFSHGSNTAQIWYKGAQVTWARMGEQNLGRTLGWQGQQNLSREQDPMIRAKLEALGDIKSELEYIGREGVYNVPGSAGTTGTWQQRGYRYAPGINNVAADGASPGAGTLGTLGTLTYDVLATGLQAAWDSRMWRPGNSLVCLTNSTGLKQINQIFYDRYDLGKNSEMTEAAGMDLKTFKTEWGNVEIVKTHNLPQDTVYFLNVNEMDLVARPVPGMPNGGFLFEKAFGDGNEKANKGVGIYGELGIDHGVGSSHIRIYGVGSVYKEGVTVSAT